MKDEDRAEFWGALSAMHVMTAMTILSLAVKKPEPVIEARAIMGQLRALAPPIDPLMPHADRFSAARTRAFEDCEAELLHMLSGIGAAGRA
jgi:hypothetical protein